MKRPLYNREERQSIVDNTISGNKLDLQLKLKLLRRDCNCFEWWICRKIISNNLNKMIQHKGFN